MRAWSVSRNGWQQRIELIEQVQSLYVDFLMAPSLVPWENSPSHVTLAKSQVHLWRFRLDLLAAEAAGLQRLLSRDELARAERLLDPAKAHHFVVARGRLRQVLSRYLDHPPEELSFAYGAHGKPRLVGAAGEALQFNLSHAGCWGLLAVASGVDIGVDVEKIDLGLDCENIATRFFSAEETAQLMRYHVTHRRRGFYRLWTRKEAWLKGQGCGFSVSATVMTDAKWWIRSFTVDRDYPGAFATAGRVTSVHRWHFV